MRRLIQLQIEFGTKNARNTLNRPQFSTDLSLCDFFLTEKLTLRFLVLVDEEEFGESAEGHTKKWL